MKDNLEESARFALPEWTASFQEAGSAKTIISIYASFLQPHQITFEWVVRKKEKWLKKRLLAEPFSGLEPYFGYDPFQQGTSESPHSDAVP